MAESTMSQSRLAVFKEHISSNQIIPFYLAEVENEGGPPSLKLRELKANIDSRVLMIELIAEGFFHVSCQVPFFDSLAFVKLSF